MLFSDVKQYIPVKLCKSTGSIHLFQLYGQLDSNQIVLEKNCLHDIIKNRLERGLCDFEWHYNKNVQIS